MFKASFNKGNFNQIKTARKKYFTNSICLLIFKDTKYNM
jgi:hypothetical protein